MRYNSYQDFKECVHEQGVTLSELARYMHISPASFKREFERDYKYGTDFQACVDDAMKEVKRNHEYCEKYMR